MIRYAVLPALCLAIAACGNDPAPAEDGQENLDARGEVLGGSISDDMLPLDALTSQAPSRALPQEEGPSEDTAEPDVPEGDPEEQVPEQEAEAQVDPDEG